MPFTKRVSVIMPFDQWLSAGQNNLKWGIVDEIEALGYETEIFFDPRGDLPPIFSPGTMRLSPAFVRPNGLCS
jgi:hypothetical protein